jgi:hypothetical protein
MAASHPLGELDLASNVERVASNAAARRFPILYESTMLSASPAEARAVLRSPAAIAIST